MQVEASTHTPGHLRSLPRFGPSFPIFTALILACVVFFWTPAPLADPDIWWHLRDVQTELATHHFITEDLFSSTAAHATWMNHEWLAELPFYAGWRLGGPRGLYLTSLAAIEAILLTVFYRSYRAGGSAAAALVVSVAAAALASVSYGPRTLLFGWICLQIELLLLDHLPQKRHLAWALPPLFSVWVNTHGSWLIGIVLLATYILGEAIDVHVGSLQQVRSTPILLPALACLPALLLNPYGWHLVAYPFDLAFRQTLNVANVEEWRSLDFHSARGKVLIVMLGTLLLFQVLKRPMWRLHELAFVAIGTYAALAYSRFLFLAAILITPIVARQLGWPPTKAGVGKPLLNLAILVALLPLVVRRSPTYVDVQTQAHLYPQQALAYLATFHPTGLVLNEFLWGGFLEFYVPQLPVFIDSRVDIFERNGTFLEYLNIVHLQQSVELLDQHHIRYVLYERDAPLTYMLRQTGRWQIDYEDSTTILLERR